MPRRYTEKYWIYRGPRGELLMKYEEDWETIEVEVPNDQHVVDFAKRRSPDYVIKVLDDFGNETRRYTPNVIAQKEGAVFLRKLRSNPCSGVGHGVGHSLGSNPSSQPTEGEVEHYRNFHGVPPNKFIDMNVWVPGGMVLAGKGKDVGYGILNKHSNKDGWYVHDFGSSVQVYRKAKGGEQADKTWSSFPRQLTVLGYNIGFSYIDDDGQLKEVKGSNKKYLAVTPNKKTLVVVGNSGVEYVMEGGSMRVEDWIYD